MQTVVERERDRDRDRDITNKKRKEEDRTKYARELLLHAVAVCAVAHAHRPVIQTVEFTASAGIVVGSGRH
jgi:hypothetical protein